MIDWRHIFSESNLDIVFRVDDSDLWAATYARLDFCPVDYLASMLDYQFAYQLGHGGDWRDLSMVLLWDGKPVGCWPLTISRRDGIAGLSSQGLPIRPPIFVGGISPRTCKKLVADSLRAVNRLAVALGLTQWRSSQAFSEHPELSDWHLAAMGEGAHCAVFHEMYIDLRQTLAEIKAGFRKSFRSLVTSGERLWRVEILRAPGDSAVWEEFRKLHIEVAGRVTRSLESWELQHAALADDEAFLVVLRDAESRMVGAGYFMCSRDEGAYAVAAYDRTLFDKPLGHVVQYHAIQEMQRRGCRWYRLGALCFPGDDPMPTEKELAIASFKQGFASNVFPAFLLTHPVLSE